ncbi:HIT domain-containing protein [Acetobacteraceae bacterium]|nr:HIT domain-containing protein [Acetobacteraceae bacterium]
MTVPYDPDNIFAKIIKGLIPANIITKNAHALAFHDIAPKAKIHAIVIPTGPYQNFSEFNSRASQEEKNDFWNLVEETAHLLESHFLEKAEDKSQSGFRLITNQGPNAGQEVEHFHVHILGGQKLFPLHSES